MLEMLVGFLRCAMPGLREPVSTVDAELRLARAYGRLQEERGSTSGWCIEELQHGTLHVQFPSLLMLPLLALGAHGSNPLLTTQAANGRITLTLSGLREVSLQSVQHLPPPLQTFHATAFAPPPHPPTN